MKMARILCGFLGLLLGISLQAAFELVKDGRPVAAILLDQKATISAQLGAYELQHHVKLMTQATLPIYFGRNTSKLPNEIKIGGDNADFIGEQNKIIFSGHRLLLTGGDSPRYHQVTYAKSATFPGLYERKGTLFAVYDFLNFYCDVHFYWMDETGTTYPTTKNLAVKAVNREFTPPMDAFRDVYDDDCRCSKFQVSPRDRALWKLRWRLSSLFGQTNHNQYSIYFAHWDKAKNPRLAKAFKYKAHDMFAQGHAGKNSGVDPILRENYPFDVDLPPQLCYSNPKTIKYYANEVLTYYNGHNVLGGWFNRNGQYPTTQRLMNRYKNKPFFYPFEGGDSGGYCFCPQCKKQFALDTPDNISNSKFNFIAKIAREVAKTAPDAGISTLAYIRSYSYPRQVDLPPNISVQLCPTIYSWWHPVLRQNQLAAYKEWVAKEAKRRPLTVWTYIFSTYWDANYHFAKYKPFPGLYPWKAAEIFKMFARDGIRGWFTEVEMQYTHLEACIAARICYDPNLDTDKYIDDYFRNYYGAAGDVMKEFYREIEHAYWDARNYPAEWARCTQKVLGPRGAKHPFWGTGLHSPDVNWRLGTAERMAKLNNLIEQAKKLVRTPNEKIRLQRIIDGIWTNTVVGKAEYARLVQRKKIPPKSLIIKRVPDAHGDFKQVAWQNGQVAHNWKDIFGKDINSKCRMTVVADAQYLYLHFEDPRAVAPLAKFWEENIELFFAADKKYPLYQLAIDPQGNFKQYKHTIGNDVKRLSAYDFQARIKSRTHKNLWTVDIAIPLKRLPIRNGKLSLNFARSNVHGNAVWMPFFTNGYVDGLDCYGTAAFYPLKLAEKDWKIWGRCWNLKDSAASDGRAVAQLVNSGWSLRYYLPKTFAPGKYRVTCAVRCDAPKNGGARCGVGFFDPRTKKTLHLKFLQLAQIAGEKYQVIQLGDWNLKPGDYFFIGGMSKKFPDKKIYIDYLELDPLF